MADVFENKLKSSYDEPDQEQHADQVDVPARPQVPRLRRLQEGDGLPQAGRRGDFRHAAGLPLGAFRLRHRRRASTSSWRSRSPSTARPRARCSSWRRSRTKKNLKVGVGLMVRHCKGRQELHERINGGRDRRHHRYCAPTAWAARPAPPVRKPEGHEGTALPDAAVPRLPLGQRRPVQRLLHPPDRRVLLDEGRLAGQGPRPRRPPLPRQQALDQNFDTYSVEYTFADGTKLLLQRPQP